MARQTITVLALVALLQTAQWFGAHLSVTEHAGGIVFEDDLADWIVACRDRYLTLAR